MTTEVAVTAQSVKRGIDYAIDLVQAGWDGVLSVRTVPTQTGGLGTGFLAPAAIGAGVGALGACLKRDRVAGHRVAVGSLVGTALGLGVGVAWASRGYAATAARSARQRVTTVRDAHWLESHPIAYA